jgi:hypothetical protein
MGNKKSSKLRKKERRLAEVARAQNVRVNVASSQASEVIIEDRNDKFVGKSGYHELPEAEIKKDMIKNVAFLVFAVAVIAGIKISGWSL